MKFPMIAKDWKIHFGETFAYPEMASVFETKLEGLEYLAELKDINTNSSQINHEDFDTQVRVRLERYGSVQTVDQKNQDKGRAKHADIVWDHKGRRCVIEIEKANHEKYLRDLLKMHQYVHEGASAVVLIVPEQHAHKGGASKQLKIATDHIRNAKKYGMWNSDLDSKFLLVSYKMVCTLTKKEYSKELRASFISAALKAQSGNR